MMCKFHNPRVVDKCMRNIIEELNKHLDGTVTICACCCGHGKYPMSLVVAHYFPEAKNSYQCYEWFSGKFIPRKKRYYVKDKEGYYFIPECVGVK